MFPANGNNHTFVLVTDYYKSIYPFRYGVLPTLGAMAGSFNSILYVNQSDNGAPRMVITLYDRDWSSYIFVMNNIHTLSRQRMRSKDVYV
jgi:hypothetical protein